MQTTGTCLGGNGEIEGKKHQKHSYSSRAAEKHNFSTSGAEICGPCRLTA